ncbi:winged helix-turn-helix transcriptional regulator [Nonomuraea sp. NPDC049421]|uniref:winged helix-turn-helix transcriptional regulator n=1 Tax=Nonomuraea sp. NPDC049421 TaxID=3155275 RepID=UPI0034299905
MARELREQDAGCAIAQAAAVVGEWWSLLIVREVTRGRHRFDDLHAELGISRRVLAERLKHLLDHGVLERRPYQQRPTRYEYRLTAAGHALAPLLAGLQDWGERFLLGDGAPATAPTETETARLHALPGTPIPHPLLLRAANGDEVDVVAPDARATVILAGDVFAGGQPGAFAEAGVALRGVTTREVGEQALRGVTTQEPGEQAFPVLSDAELTLCAALGLPTFRTGHTLHLKPVVIVADAHRTIRHVLCPATDATAALKEALRLAAGVTSRFVR